MLNKNSNTLCELDLSGNLISSDLVQKLSYIKFN